MAFIKTPENAVKNVFPFKPYDAGRCFIYRLGTEPFLYIADPECLKRMSAGVMGKSWGKPTVFKNDRKPLFGNGLTMVEGDDWVRHRQAMANLMVESITGMLDRWTALISSGETEIDVQREFTRTTGDIIVKTSFGLSYEHRKQVFEKLTSVQLVLFKSNRCVGVPFGKFMCPKQTLEAKKLGKEIDALLLSIITTRKSSLGHGQKDLHGILLAENHGVSPEKMLTTSVKRSSSEVMRQRHWRSRGSFYYWPCTLSGNVSSGKRSEKWSEMER
ncbi:unnamed protein product [Ilex paraguariensis]|uniref:Cytochrome P450 n=1 Tax=Ilex paraguariensis TaxID=185542 RepID=A0ABC8SUW3_9AQUA